MEELDTSWFNLKNYDEFKTMSIKDWAFQLQIRNEFHAREIFTREYVGEADRDCLPILKAGVVHEYSLIDNALSIEDLKNRIGLNKQAFSTGSVNSLETYSLWDKMNKYYFQDVRDSCQHVDNFFDKKEELNTEVAKIAFAPFDFHLHEKWGTDDEHLAHVQINPYATDEQIKHDLIKWLLHYRKSNKIKIEKKIFTQADFDYWIKYKLIPYLDLTLIAKTEDKKITQHKLAKMLFPDEYNIDIVERLRKVTKPEADGLIKNKVYCSLNAQFIAH